MEITRYTLWLVLREAQNRKIIIYGDNNIGYDLERKLNLCDVTVSYFVADTDSESNDIKNVYELMYENPDEIFVIITEPDYERCERKLQEIGLKEVTHYRRVDSLIDNYPIKWYLDVQLGHTYKLIDCPHYGVRIFGDNSEKSFRIITLGGSNTDAHLYPFASWSEALYRICKRRGHNVTVICAGVSSYTASQELLKLERDLLLRNPDMVISYSGINDIYMEDDKKFASSYHRSVYWSSVLPEMGKLNRKGIFTGENNYLSAFEWWLACERMMYGICTAFHIPFFGILQGLLGGKKWNIREKEIFLNGTWYGRYPAQYRKNFEKEALFRNKMKELDKAEYPFLYDFSGLFDDEDVFCDGTHVNERGNTIIAQNIYQLIEKRIAEKT